MFVSNVPWQAQLIWPVVFVIFVALGCAWIIFKDWWDRR